jgi:mycothiol synthase
MPHRPAKYRGGTMRIELHDSLTPDVLADVQQLLDAWHARDVDEVLGEPKRAQLTVGASRWSGALAREEGAPVGYAHVRWEPAGHVPTASAELVVAPGHEQPQAVADGLLEALRRRVADAGGGTLYVWAHGVANPSASLPAGAGLEVERLLAVMSRPLELPPDDVTPPAGVTLGSYRPGTDDESLLRVNNFAFAGHPEQGDWDAETLEGRRARSWFDPEGVLLAWKGDRLLGFHWTKVHPGPEPVGEVYVLGVGPDAQGTGIGKLLLRAGLAHLHERGCRRVILYVDRSNAAAVRLYESIGFETTHYEVCYAEEVPPGEG